MKSKRGRMGFGGTRQGIDHAIYATVRGSDFVRRTTGSQWRVPGRGLHGLMGYKSGFWVEARWKRSKMVAGRPPRGYCHGPRERGRWLCPGLQQVAWSEAVGFNIHLEVKPGGPVAGGSIQVTPQEQPQWEKLPCSPVSKIKAQRTGKVVSLYLPLWGDKGSACLSHQS